MRQPWTKKWPLRRSYFRFEERGWSGGDGDQGRCSNVPESPVALRGRDLGLSYKREALVGDLLEVDLVGFAWVCWDRRRRYQGVRGSFDAFGYEIEGRYQAERRARLVQHAAEQDPADVRACERTNAGLDGRDQKPNNHPTHEAAYSRVCQIRRRALHGGGAGVRVGPCFVRERICTEESEEYR